MKTDIRNRTGHPHCCPLTEVAAKSIGIGRATCWSPTASTRQRWIHRSEKHVPERAKLILVTAINPTPAGEGKTTTSVGLADALATNGQEDRARPCGSRPWARCSA